MRALLFAAALALPALAEVPGEGKGDFVRFELEVQPGERFKLVLTEVRVEHGEEVRIPWTLVRADGWLPPDLPESPWLAFRGRYDGAPGDEPQFRRDLWLVAQAKGVWQVASVPKRQETGDGVHVLQVIRPDEEGRPALVYVHESTGRTLTRPVKGFEKVRSVTFLPPAQ